MFTQENLEWIAKSHKANMYGHTPVYEDGRIKYYSTWHTYSEITETSVSMIDKETNKHIAFFNYEDGDWYGYYYPKTTSQRPYDELMCAMHLYGGILQDNEPDESKDIELRSLDPAFLEINENDQKHLEKYSNIVMKFNNDKFIPCIECNDITYAEVYIHDKRLCVRLTPQFLDQDKFTYGGDLSMFASHVQQLINLFVDKVNFCPGNVEFEICQSEFNELTNEINKKEREEKEETKPIDDVLRQILFEEKEEEKEEDATWRRVKSIEFKSNYDNSCTMC